MNKIHRIVWNEETGTWVAVAEKARGRGKGGGRARKAALAALISSSFVAGSALAELPATTVVPASGKTNAYISANGVPVVNIETANASGLSHNRYTGYNVEANGLVLNNGNNSQISRQSQLAGQVVSNLNLVQEAKVILNEVVSTNRSMLAGFTEVLGGRADVIVANPNGITCNGCGFINTDRVTLSTGTANLGASGSLTGFTVNRGDLLVNGAGVNGSTQQVFDMVARSVKIDGTINVPAASSLGVYTGNNAWSYVGRAVTGSATGIGTAAVYAFDSTALGGMYAGRIRIVATEAGVGVRMLGEAAASADDFTLSSAGKIEIQSAVSALRDTSISSTSATGSQDLFINGAGAKVSANRNLDLSATTGQVKLTEGELYAANNLSLSGASLSDASVGANTRFAGVNTNLTTSGSANIDGAVWGAGGALSGTFGSLSVSSSGATIYAGTTLGLSTTANMSLATAAVRSAGDMTLTATAGGLSTSTGTAQGVQSTAGNLSLNAGNGLTNAGTISADAGSLSTRVNGMLSNSGTLHAKTTLDMADQSASSTENVTNSGIIIADGNLIVKAASFVNQSGAAVQGTTGSTFTATSLTNAGTFISSNTAGQSGNFTLTSLTNNGTLQSSEDLVLGVTGTLANTGKLLATHDLAVNAGAAALAITNTSPGLMQAGNALTITGSNATFNTQSGSVLGNTTGVTVSNLNNSGTLQSNAAMTLAVGNGFTNSGTLLSKTSLTSNSASLTNSGTLQADSGSTLTTTGALTNTGTLIASSSTTNGANLNIATLNNSGGVIQSAQDLAINVSGNSLTNSAKIIAARNLTLNSTGSGLTLSNQSGGYLQAGSSVGDKLTIGGTAVVLNNNAGGSILGDQLIFNLASLTNAGTIQGGTAASSVTSSGALSNSGTLTLATSGSAASTVSANTMGNTGILQSASDMGLTVTNGLVNSGTLLTAKSLTSNSSSLNNSGTLQANLGSSITTGALTNTGTLIASSSTTNGANLNIATLNNSGGVIQSAQGLAINVSGNSLTNSAKIIAARDLTLNSTGSGLTLFNQSGGYLQSGSSAGNTLSIGGNAVTLNNNSGANAIGNQLTFGVSSLTNAGTIQGGTSASVLTVGGTLINSGELNLSSTSAGSGTVTADAISNSGTLQSQGAATFNVATSLTNSGNLLTGGAVTVRGTDSAYTVSNTKRMQSGGLMDIAGQSSGNGVNITVGGTAIMLGDSLNVKAGTLTIDNGGMVSSAGDMTLALDTLSFGGTTSRIVAANTGTGNASVILTNPFSNIGAVHSSDNLTFLAPSLTNTSTGGFSALNTLTVRATSGNLSNAGALYAGSQLNASATGNFTNIQTTGTIDSGGSMDLSAGGIFTNNNNINAAQDVTITSNTFRNEITGGVPNRSWSAINWGSDYETSRDGSFGWPYDATYYYRKDGSRTQSFDSAIQGTKPYIITGRNMTIQGFTSAFNTSAILSASNGTMAITGSGTFTNEDLSLKTEKYSATWNRYEDCGFFTCDSIVTRSYTEYVTDTSTARSYGAGIFSNTLNASGFNLVNQSSPWAASPTSRTATGATGSALGSSASGTSGGSALSVSASVSAASAGAGVAGLTTASGASAISFQGLVITLPTNPNGYFVISKNSKSKFLVETNSLFSVGSNFVGSDYMAQRYGYNPDTVIKRLGDANYEAYLIRQQLISQTGNNIIKGYGNEADQIKRLMDQAVTQGTREGFVFGSALTATQIANLKEDVVWMVETTVEGQKVLAPVVYLSANTRNGIATGAVIAGENVNLTGMTSVTNTGGTISGTKSLTIAASGNITNTSGTLSGGDVSLTSTTASIINETITSGSGNSENYATSIGKTAGISATGNLALDAKKDITVKGGNVTAGGDASLAAGGNITFDTIVDKTTSTTRSSTSSLFNSSSETKTTSTEKNIGSGLAVGGNLAIKSTGDTTIAGSTVSAGGDMDVDTGGKFNVIARQDKTTTKSVSTTSGLGVGGGIAGSQKTTTDSFDGTNKGSSITVGGNATIKSAGNMTLQGSDLTVAGDGKIDAKSINVLDGLDEKRSTTVTETTTYLSKGSATDSSSGSKSASASSKTTKSATASADASAKTSESSELNLASVSVKTEVKNKTTSVASNMTFGGNLSLTAKDKITIQGSNIAAGGDVALDAKNIEVLTGRNEETVTVNTSTTKVGIYTDSKAGASASAEASATGMSPNAKAGAEANASADSTATIGARLETSSQFDKTVTNTASTIKSGGNLSIKAKETAKFVGAKVESTGDLSIAAKDITNLAAQDTTESRSSSSKTTTGLYLSGEASAGASAQAKAGTGGMGAGAKVGVEAKAEVSAGLRVATDKSSSEEGSTTNVVSSFKSGGSITRTASNTIMDQGTQLEAGGDINQTAKTVTEIAAIDSAYKTTSSSSMDARIGVYADAGANAGAGAAAGVGGKSKSASAEADASAGVKAKFTSESASDSQSATTTVTSRYKAGGSINSTSTEGTTLIGTKFEAGKDINLSAKTLDFQAAKDTTTQSSSGNSASAQLKAGVAVSGGKVEAEAAYEQSGASANSSTAKAGGLNAAGSISIKTQGDTTLVGTTVEAGKDVGIASKEGSVKLEAAKSTTDGKSDGFNVSANLKVSGQGAEGGAAGGFNKGSNESTTNAVVSIKSGGATSISAGKDVVLEGSALKSGGNTDIEAKGTVKMTEVRDTEKSSSINLQASVQLSKESQSGGVNVAAEGLNKQKSSAAQIDSGGTLSIKGGTVVNQQADLKSTAATTIAGKVENINKTADVDTGYKVDVGVDVARTAKAKEDTKPATTTFTSSAAPTRVSTTTPAVPTAIPPKSVKLVPTGTPAAVPTAIPPKSVKLEPTGTPAAVPTAIPPKSVKLEPTGTPAAVPMTAVAGTPATVPVVTETPAAAPQTAVAGTPAAVPGAAVAGTPTAAPEPAVAGRLANLKAAIVKNIATTENPYEKGDEFKSLSNKAGPAATELKEMEVKVPDRPQE